MDVRNAPTLSPKKVIMRQVMCEAVIPAPMGHPKTAPLSRGGLDDVVLEK